LYLTIALCQLIACGGDSGESPAFNRAAMDPAFAAMTTETLHAAIARLASDSFEGRAPGTRGEDSTVAYLVEQFRALGLKPGNPNGSYTQDVPLVGITPRVTASIRTDGRAVPLAGRTEYIASSRRVAPLITVENSDLIFVGYGVIAPEYDWNDYKDVDVTGKTIVMLVNDPAIPSAADPSMLDTAMFKGQAMTYYGRWTYKYEVAAERGAAAAIVIHETGPAGYPFEVLSSGFEREGFDIKPADNNMGAVAVEAWMPEIRARKLMQDAGQDFDALKKAALSKDFRPVPLNSTISFTLRQTTREVQSRNVVGLIEGSHVARKDEYVIYTAHWDHLGRDSQLQGDQIFNGALDNATGTASLLELARAYSRLETPPDRSILFLAVTAEEKGLLGAKYYARDPLYPLSKTVANVNMDGMNQWGRTRDIVVIGMGMSSLEDYLADAAAAQGRTLAPDPESEKGFFYRSDQFEFARQGVPALYTDSGTEYIGKADGYGRMRRNEYTTNDYHKVTDEVKAAWDLAGAIDDLKLLFEVGYRASQIPGFPEWKPGTEFKAKRDAMLAR
jgi:Zn-dependent M28 family amino/carboxypeptidase